MKKLVIIIVVLLILAGAGGGAYYYFYMMNDDEYVIQEGEEELPPESPAESQSEAAPEPVFEKNKDYYVTSQKLNVLSYPDDSSLLRSVLRKGQMVTAAEIKGEWVRISEYMVHSSGNDIADWVHMDFLSEKPPAITPEEKRKTFLSLIQKSDDLVTYEDQMIVATESLIDEGMCTYDDFELVGGWVSSIAYEPDPVYFVYCGGTQRKNKVYLNVKSGEIFYP